jgi:ferredoxin-NADP reductase
MTTGMLALLILCIVFLQIMLALSISIYRRRSRLAETGATSCPGQQGLSGQARQTLKPGPSKTQDDRGWDGYLEFSVKERFHENTDKSICSFYLAPLDARPLPPFKPGQYLTLKLATKETAGQDTGHLVRCYSLSDRPNEYQYRISVKRAYAPSNHTEAPPGVVSNYIHDHLRVGDRLMVKPPSGRFHLIEDSPLPVVLIGGGVGITPMISMLNSLLETGSKREIWLFYSVRDGNELIMGDHLLSLSMDHDNFHLHLCFSRPNEWGRGGQDFQHRGRIDISLLRDNLKLGRYQFYICGPSGMIENLVLGLESLGIDSGDVHYESFGPSTLTRPQIPDNEEKDDNKQTLTVTFNKSGKQVRWSQQSGSILELAEGLGIEVESGCRAGCCGSCATHIESGEVEYSQEPETDVEPGCCLLCIASPKGDLELSV